MASMNDARDIMGLAAGQDLPKPPPLKKQKSVPTKRVTGINREVQALYGERAPPVAVVEAGKSYQPKRKWGANKGPAQKWIQRPFTNPARTDGLVLRHWQRLDPNNTPPAQQDGDVTMENTENQDPLLETDYPFAKYNIQPDGPEYDDELYEAHLRSEEWSKEETDYLVETVKEYHHRWPVIADRYDFQPKQLAVDPNAPDGAAAPQAKMRDLEDMKYRYYQISAKLMELKTPIASMTNAEFRLHEILTKFDPEREKQRKKVAAALLERHVDDIAEEQFLLGELQRINTNYERLCAEREEVRARLGAPQTQGNTSAAQFQSSAALSQLFNQLLAHDRSKKRNGRLSLNTSDSMGGGTPSGHQTPVTGGGLGGGHRDSLGGGAQGHNKRASLVGASGLAAQQQQQSMPPRQLTPRAQQRLGVTQHERLTSGVTFRSDRLNKMRLAKSTIQTQKVAAALAELRIPEIIALPTVDVCDAFEGLVGKIHKLLDLRKLLEKEEAEVAVAENVRKERLRREALERGEDPDAAEEADGEGEGDKKEANANGNGNGEAAAAVANGKGKAAETNGAQEEQDKDGDADGDADADADVDADGDADAEGEADTPMPDALPAAGQKRSASEMSGR